MASLLIADQNSLLMTVFLGHMLHTPRGRRAGGGGVVLVLVRLYLYACLSAADIIVNSSVILELPPLC